MDVPVIKPIDYGSDQSDVWHLSYQRSSLAARRTDPASAAAWNWLVVGGVTQPTNFNNSPPPGGVDQPWLLVNVDPTIPTQDNVYTAYDDFTNGSNCAGEPASSEYRLPTVSTRLTSQLIINPEQPRVASTQVTDLLSIREMASSIVYSSGISLQELEDRKTSTTCSIAPLMAAPHGP